jgi:uncharacterized protein
MYIKRPIKTPLKARVPASGVRLTSGVINDSYRNNNDYLKHLSMDSTLYWFRRKARLEAPGEPYTGHFEDNIKGQTAGLMLMGAANSLRWEEDAELRRRVNDTVAAIAAAQESDGFFEPIPKSEFGTLEYPNYVRVWMNYGLLAAHMVGNERALGLMREMQDWFNTCDERVIAKDLTLGFQGVIANTTVYLTEAGVPEDLQVTVDHYQENWWLAQLTVGDHKAIYQRPRPHGTELEAITAYMDMYIATGKPMYLNAVNGAYAMFREKWQHVGGGIIAIEHTEIEPGCYWLDPLHKYNELCCSAHWIYLNQRYHMLNPDVEEHVGEIEKSIYNVAVANQAGGEHIRYHAFIDTQKDENRFTPVSCCAGIGTRVYGSLPEFLYSTTDDGIYVDIYSGSSITWKQGGSDVTLTTDTDQPTGGRVQIGLSMKGATTMKLRLRIPAWATGETPIALNGSTIATGTPGTYETIDREWKDGDTITFTLPMGFRVTEYDGLDVITDPKRRHITRRAFEYGPLLLAFVGPLNYSGRYLRILQDPYRPEPWLVPIAGKPCHYTIPDMPGYEVMPYHEVDTQTFTCYPVF